MAASGVTWMRRRTTNTDSNQDEHSASNITSAGTKRRQSGGEAGPAPATTQRRKHLPRAVGGDSNDNSNSQQHFRGSTATSSQSIAMAGAPDELRACSQVAPVGLRTRLGLAEELRDYTVELRDPPDLTGELRGLAVEPQRARATDELHNVKNTEYRRVQRNWHQELREVRSQFRKIAF